jgi:hypothetical protein
MGVAIVIPEMPSLAAQVAAWHATPRPTWRAPGQCAPPKPRKAARNAYPPRGTHLSGRGIEAAILRVVGKRTVHLHDLYGAMPRARITSIKACLTGLVQAGLLIRPRKAHYRAAP